MMVQKDRVAELESRYREILEKEVRVPENQRVYYIKWHRFCNSFAKFLQWRPILDLKVGHAKDFFSHLVTAKGANAGRGSE